MPGVPRHRATSLRSSAVEPGLMIGPDFVAIVFVSFLFERDTACSSLAEASLSGPKLLVDCIKVIEIFKHMDWLYVAIPFRYSKTWLAWYHPTSYTFTCVDAGGVKQSGMCYHCKSIDGCRRCIAAPHFLARCYSSSSFQVSVWLCNQGREAEWKRWFVVAPRLVHCLLEAIWQNPTSRGQHYHGEL